MEALRRSGSHEDIEELNQLQFEKQRILSGRNNFSYDADFTSSTLFPKASFDSKNPIVKFDKPYSFDEILNSLKNKFNSRKLSTEDLKARSWLRKYPEVGEETVEDTDRYISAKKARDLLSSKGFDLPVEGAVLASSPEYGGLYLGSIKNNFLRQLKLRQFGTLAREYGIPETEVQEYRNWLLNQPLKEAHLYYSDEPTGIAGYFTPDEMSFINLNNPKNNNMSQILSTFDHELGQHGTEAGLLKGSLKKAWQKLFDSLGFDSKLQQYRNSNKLYEFRATVGELQGHYGPRGMQKTLNSKSDEEIIEDMASLNNYGRDYKKMYYNLPPEKRKLFAQQLRKAIQFLPGVLPAALIPKNK